MLECISYTQLNKGHCLGIATIGVDKWGVDISGITLYQKDGSRWVNLPSKPYEKDGVTKYANYIRFKNVEHYKQFCDDAKKAIDVYIEKDIKAKVNERQEVIEETTFNDLKQEEIPF